MIFLRGETTTELRLRRQHGKKTRGGAQYADLERVAACAEWNVFRLHHCHGLKAAAMLLPIFKVIRVHWQRGINVLKLRHLLLQHDQLSRMRIRQWLQQHVIDKGKDGSGRANAERQGQNSDDGKARRLA